MRKFRFLLLVFIIPCCWNIYFMIWCQVIRDSRSLIELTIPESTKAFLDSIGNRIVEGIDNVVIKEVDSIAQGFWTNITDYGRKTDDSLFRYEVDSLFVFYSDVDNQDLVENVRLYALDAVNPLTEVMGRYPYPYQVKGRKLPIYICNSEKAYQKVCQKLSKSTSDFSGTWGLHVSTYCGVETQTIGIVLNKASIYKISNTPDMSLKATLWHEMNHYVFFQSLDLSKEITPYVWMYEGLAEYFASLVKKQTTHLSMIQKGELMSNTLESTFEPYLYNYSGGEIFYDYSEEKYGKEYVYNLIQLFYSMPLSVAFDKMNRDLGLEERQWKEYVKEY